MKDKVRKLKDVSAKTLRLKTQPTTPPPQTLPSLAEDYELLDPDSPIDKDSIKELESLDPSNELNDQETRLVGIYLDHPDQPKQIIAKLAGYKAKSPKALITIFNRVIAKWERGVHRLDIFRSAGLGELRVALRLRQLMMQNQNLGVAKDMVIHVSKIMDLVNPALDLADGFEIRVKRAAEPAKPAATGPDRARPRLVEKKGQITE